MIPALLWVVGGFLLFASLIDIKYKAIPSVAGTSLLFLTAILNIDNLQFGILAILFALIIKDLMYDMDGIEFGLADIKIIGVIGLLISTINGFLIFIGIFAIFQLVYTLVWNWKIKGDKERPFIPCLLVIYITLLLIGGVL